MVEGFRLLVLLVRLGDHQERVFLTLSQLTNLRIRIPGQKENWYTFVELYFNFEYIVILNLYFLFQHLQQVSGKLHAEQQSR